MNISISSKRVISIRTENISNLISIISSASSSVPCVGGLSIDVREGERKGGSCKVRDPTAKRETQTSVLSLVFIRLNTTAFGYMKSGLTNNSMIRWMIVFIDK